MDIHLYLQADSSVDFSLILDDKEVCAIKIAHTDDDTHKTAVCRFERPASASTLSLRGSYEGVHWRTKQRYRYEGERSWPLLDFGPVGTRLTQAGKPYGERMADFIAAANAFAGEHLGSDYASRFETGTPADAAAIAAAEERLGYALPAEFVSTQRTLGAFQYGDHGLIGIEQIADAETQLRRFLGESEETLREGYSEPMRANLRASTLLFVEAGDGYGALRYRPPPNESCGERPYYQWFAQDGSRIALKQADGRCMDFTAAMRWLLEGLVIDGYADEAVSEHGILLVDSSEPGQSLALKTGEDRFEVQLSVRWQGPHGLRRRPDLA